MELVRSYVAIELARFDNRFRVEYDVPPDLLAALVPPLTIQPLVENASATACTGRRAPSPYRPGGTGRCCASPSPTTGWA